MAGVLNDWWAGAQSTCGRCRAYVMGWCRMSSDRQLKAAVGLMAVVLLFLALYVASAVFAPVALALFIIAIVWPLQSWLQERLPKLLALAISMLVTIVVFLAFSWLVVWAFRRVGRWLMSDTARFQARYDQAVAWFEGHGLSIASLWAEHFNTSWLLRTAQERTGRVNTMMSFWRIALVYVILGLLEVDDMRRKIRAMENRHAARMLS